MNEKALEDACLPNEKKLPTLINSMHEYLSIIEENTIVIEDLIDAITKKLGFIIDKEEVQTEVYSKGDLSVADFLGWLYAEIEKIRRIKKVLEIIYDKI